MSMEGIGAVIRRKKPEANKRLHSDAHALADEISAHFNERKRFAMYLGIINRLGVSKARSIFAQVKSEAGQLQNPRKFFMWLAKNPGKDPQP